MSNNIPNSSNKISVSKLQSEHVKIVSLLSKNKRFKRFIDRHEEFQVEKDPRAKFTELLKKEFKDLFDELSKHYGKSISKLQEQRILKKNTSTLSGRLKVLNVLLEDFCKQQKKAIDPSIQVFTSHHKLEGGFKDGIHFACAEKITGDNNKSYSKNNISLDNAKNGKAKSNQDCQSEKENPESSITDSPSFFRYPKRSNDSDETIQNYNGPLRISSIGRYKRDIGYEFAPDPLLKNWLFLAWVTNGQLSGKIKKTDGSLSNNKELNGLLEPGQIAIAFPKSKLLDWKTDEESTVWWCCLEGTITKYIKEHKLKEGIFPTNIEPDIYFDSWIEKLNMHEHDDKEMWKLDREYSRKSEQLLLLIGDHIARQNSVYQWELPE